MDLYFIFIQIIGFLAWVLLAVSYYRKNTNRILAVQLIGNLLFCLHYFLLTAWSGLAICFLETVRDFSYYKTDLDDYIFFFTIPIYIIGGIVTIKTGLIELVPIIASITDGWSLTKKKKIVVIGAIVSYSLWFIYDLVVGSHSGAITDLIIIISNIYIILFKKDDKELFIIHK